jgi:hypothetical protein
LQALGSKRSNSFWEAAMPAESRLPQAADRTAREALTRDKYEHKKFLQVGRFDVVVVNAGLYQDEKWRIVSLRARRAIGAAATCKRSER